MNTTVAATAQKVAEPFLEKIKDAILFPLISLLLGVALLVFLWGVFEYIRNADSDEARTTGRKHMIFGVIGFVVMLSALAILQVVVGTFDLEVPPY